MDIVAAAAALSKAAEIAKLLRGIEKGFDVAEYKAKAADMLSSLADAKIAVVEASEQIAAKDREIAALKEIMRRKREDLIEYHGYWFRKKADGSPVGDPYCRKCDEVDGLLVPTSEAHEPNRPQVCPQCKSKYYGISKFYWD